MVALKHNQLKLPPDTIIADLRKAIQGHVGASVKQTLQIERSRVIRNPQLRLEAYEVILKDQFTNLYVAFVSTLPDEEDHAVITWVGSDRRGINKKYTVFRAFSDDMLRHLQDEAFVAFGRQVVAIMKARTAADGVMLTSEDAGTKVIEFPKPEAINQSELCPPKINPTPTEPASAPTVALPPSPISAVRSRKVYTPEPRAKISR